MDEQTFDAEWRRGTVSVTKGQLERLKERREVTFFVVEGVGDFPLDMLRFDECWPVAGEDAILMMIPYPEDSDWAGVSADRRGGGKHRRRIHMGAARAGLPAPTVARWESFGWRVLPEGK